MTAIRIKLVYCYLVCFVSVGIITLNLASATQSYMGTRFFDTYQIPESLEFKAFKSNGPYAKLSEAEIETERQKAIEMEKMRHSEKQKENILSNFTYAFYAALLLLIHAVIIRKSKENG